MFGRPEYWRRVATREARRRLVISSMGQPLATGETVESADDLFRVA